VADGKTSHSAFLGFPFLIADWGITYTPQPLIATVNWIFGSPCSEGMDALIHSCVSDGAEA
jgi:hypothetical protein